MNKVPALFLALLLAAAGFLLLGFSSASGFSSDDPEPDGPTTSATPTQEPPSESPGDDPSDGDPSDTPSDPPEEEGCSEPEEAVAAFLETQGFDDSDYVVGVEALRWGKIPVRNVADPFTDEPLTTKAAVRAFVDGDNPSSQMARQLIGDDVLQAYWVPVQFQTMVLYSGNYSWNEATGATQNNGVAQVAGGDIWWFNVDFWPEGCEVDLEDTIRAVCGNVGLTAIAPYAAPPSRDN